MKKIHKIMLAALILASCTKTPEACFTIDNGSSTKLNEEIQFNATCTTNASSYAWDYGDGVTGNGAQTMHKYTVEGNYTIKLSVSNKNKSATQSKTITITK